MADEPSDPIPPELQVLMDTEIHLREMKTYAEQQSLEIALKDIPGVESLSILEGGLAIRYDPERVTRAQFCEVISRAGFQISEAESASAAPMIEPTGSGG